MKTIKTRGRRMAAGFLAAAAVTAAASLAPAGAEATELRFVHAYPVASQHNRNAEWFAEQVTERTNGEVTFRMFPAAQIMPINQELPGILSGQVALTYSVAPVVASVEPLWGIFDLPMLFDVTAEDPGHIRRFFASEKGGGVLADAMETHGFKLISLAPTDLPSGIALTSPEPATTLEGLKGEKIRIPGGRIGQLAGEEFGFNPITVAGAELVPALTQGMVNGGILPPIYIYDNKLPIKSLTLAPYAWPAVTPVIMSLSVFNGLTEEQQKVVLEVGAEMEEHAFDVVRQSAAEKIGKMQDEMGVAVAELSEDEATRWRDQAQGVWEAFAEENGEAARTMLEEAKRLRTSD